MNIEPQRLGRYELQERLGWGSMAEVWKAFDLQLQRAVALKLLHADLQNDPDFSARFLREARIVAGLRHPNIVQLHDFQITRLPQSQSTVAYMVMDYVEGQTLADYLDQTSRQQRYPAASELVQLFASVSLAVDYAHQQGMIHRDLKPANILLDRRNTRRNPMGEPILTDFGLVKLLGPSSSALSSTWLGTPLYVSPEQAQGQAGDARSDIYALGVILYELCTGTLPFEGETAMAVLTQQITAALPSPVLRNPRIPPGVAQVIARSLAKEPAARYGSAAALVVELAAGFGQAVPESLRHLISAPEPGNELTVRRSGGPLVVSPPAQTPVLPTSVPVTPPLPVLPAAIPLPVASGSETSMPTLLMTPVSGIELPATQTPKVTTPIPMEPSRVVRRRRRMGLLWVSVFLLALVVLGGGVGTWLWVGHQTTPPRALVAANPVLGTAFFVSSGQLNEGTAQGINDELQLTLHHLAAPLPGKSYFAWLMSDKEQKSTKYLLLGELPVSAGSVSFLYPGNAQHTNLIAVYSRLLITEENSNSNGLTQPDSNHAMWRYYAELPQIRILTGNHFSALDHLRNLFYEGTFLRSLGIHGGLNVNLLRNTEKVWEWVRSARDSWSNNEIAAAFMHRQIVRTLDYLDGIPLLPKDVPPGTALLVHENSIKIPLVNIVKNDGHASYLDRTDGELNRLIQSPGITPQMRVLASQVDRILLLNVQTWLETVRKDAKKLVIMTDMQLMQPSALALLNDMATQVNYALVGRLDPSTNTLQQGIVQIYYNIQHLATFSVISYVAQK